MTFAGRPALRGMGRRTKLIRVAGLGLSLAAIPATAVGSTGGIVAGEPAARPPVLATAGVDATAALNPNAATIDSLHLSPMPRAAGNPANVTVRASTFQAPTGLADGLALKGLRYRAGSARIRPTGASRPRWFPRSGRLLRQSRAD